tara:strand:+ start:2836 stop:4032 length:1197 start_codon:yes stop_codon:yes gene_type:complete
MLIKKPLNLLIFTAVLLIVIPYLFGNIFGKNTPDRFLLSLCAFISFTILFEFLFRFFYKIYNGKYYELIVKPPFDKIYVESHPYFPYVYKKNFQGPPSQKLGYPLHPNMLSAELTTNNFCFYNGTNGDRDIIIPKPDKLLRINCLGASTTGNYISVENNNYSYPLELEKILQSKLPGDIEVNNCGMGGYNSADILVRFALQIIDTEPDYIIIYHAYNDINSYLTANFSTDYSHSRKNFGEVYTRLHIASKIPDIKLKFYNFLINKLFPAFTVKNNLISAVSKGRYNSNNDFSLGLKVFERNLQSIIALCSSNNIKVILSTYCFYLHEQIKNDPTHLLFNKIVTKENVIIKKLSEKNNLKLVDSASLIPRDDSYFVDSVHFTPKGMKLLAKCISDVIVK